QPLRQFHIPLKPLGKPSQDFWQNWVCTFVCHKRYVAWGFLLIFILSQGFHVLHGLSHSHTKLATSHEIPSLASTSHTFLHDSEDTAYAFHQDCLLCCHHNSPVAFEDSFSQNK